MNERLSIIAGGTCGSTVSPIQDRHSRLTTSFGIVLNDTGIVIDNGFGIQNVATFLRQAHVEGVVMFQTHYHTDHIAGLSVNDLLFKKKPNNFGIWSPNIGETDFERVWRNMFNPAHWPVNPEQFGVHPTFHTFEVGDTYLPWGTSTLLLNHPGGSVAYRFRHSSGDVVIATDHEVGNGPTTDQQYADFISGSNILIADIQYRQSEYNGEVGIGGGPAIPRKSWGHATPEGLATVLRKCADPPKHLWVTHHDPMRPQSDLDKFNLETETVFEEICPVLFAEDGDIWP